jgi:hypothetical protein
LYSGVNVLRFLRAIDNSWRIIAISGASMEAGDDHARLAPEPASTRYDTEPLPSVSVTASEPTLWIPPVTSAAAPVPTSIAPVPVVAFNAPAPTTPNVSLGVSVVVVTVSAFASAGLAALLAWALLFRG